MFRRMTSWRNSERRFAVYLCFQGVVKRMCPQGGGGLNAFSRYETGKTKPPLALVKLLRVLDRHPELLAEVKAS